MRSGHSPVATSKRQTQVPAPGRGQPLQRKQAQFSLAGILQMQRTAGNRAVQRMLAAQQKVVRAGAGGGIGDIALAPGTALPAVQMLMANVRLARDTASKDLFVSSATIERGEGTGSGAHSTAFVVFQDAAINAVLGKTFKDAVNDLITLSEKVTGLPNYIAASDKTDTDSKLSDIKKDTNYSNPDAVEDFEKVSVLQNLMREYCLLRNSVPGSYFPKISGSKTKGMKSEKSGGNKLSEENEQYRLDDNYKRNLNNTKQGLWETFDQQILPVQDSKERAGDYYPKLVAVISNHLQTCLDSYPYIKEDDFVKGCKFFVEKCILDLNSKHKKSYGSRVVDKLVKLVEKEVF